MTPTAKFRWLELPYEIGIYAEHPSGIESRDGRFHVLQQWWDSPFKEELGEWRDIPIEREA